MKDAVIRDIDGIMSTRINGELALFIYAGGRVYNATKYLRNGPRLDFATGEVRAAIEVDTVVAV